MSKWTRTAITELLQIPYPIVLGPFGRGGSSAELAAKVSNAGGLGSFGCNDLEPADITKTAADIRSLTDKPFNLNLWVSTFDEGGDRLERPTYDRVIALLKPYYDELDVEPPSFADLQSSKPKNFSEQVEAVIESRPHVFSFVFGVPNDSILRRCRAQGIVTAGAATSVDEAKVLEEAGVDIIIASGFEAGGHRPSFLKSSAESLIGTIALVPQIVDRVKKPVIAAGGIADGRGVAAALVLGAGAAVIGTAFLACDESGASDLHRKLLFQKDAQETALMKAFTGRMARGIFNRFARELQASEAQFAKYPAHNWMAAPLRTAAMTKNRADFLNLWSGQSAPLIRYHKADELFAALVKETDELLANMCH